MKRKHRDAFAEAVVGVFMLAVLALLAYFTIVISGVDVLSGHRKVQVEIVFAGVGGLKDHDNVMYRGTKVGTVEKIAVTPSNLVVRIGIDSAVRLRETYSAVVRNLSMLGGNYLELTEGTGRELELGREVLAGQQPSDWMRDVANVARRLNDFATDGNLRQIVTNLLTMSARANALVARLERGEGSLGKLLADDCAVYESLRQTLDNAEDVSGRLRRGEGMVGKLLSADETVYDNLRGTLDDISAVSARIRRGEGTVGRLLSSDGALYEELKAGVASFRRTCDSLGGELSGAGVQGVVVRAEQLLANLNEVSGRLKEGSGTLGRLVNDPKLYDEIDALVKDARQILDNYRDTTPISTFGSLVTGAL